MSRVRVLLADDHEGVLARLRTVLNEEFEVVGAVRNGRDAVEEVQRLDPDVLVIDICMPILDGLRAAAQLSSNCRTTIVFLTLHEDPDFVAAAFSAGASGYVLKSEMATDLVPAIRAAVRGHRYLSQALRP
jgi:DNA-binding NarL/FixJ family response regulator